MNKHLYYAYYAPDTILTASILIKNPKDKYYFYPHIIAACGTWS